MNRQQFIAAVFCLIFQHSRCFLRNVYPTPVQRPATGDCGEPLFLTPLLKSGKIDEARYRSEVRPFLPKVTGNSGFLTVNETYNSNMFFWFFRKYDANDWQKAPVLLWLQGGPGSSSLFGLFTENGPYSVNKDGLHLRKYAWSKEYNVLFVDNPVGSGFSYTENDSGYAVDENDVADDLYSALTQFFQLYPELRGNAFYLTGESYAGKYIPAIAHAIHRRNPRAPAKINLKGLFIGDGFCDPANMLDYGKYLNRIGLLSRLQAEQFASIEDQIRLLIKDGRWKEGGLMMDKLIGADDSLFRSFTGFPLYYDYRYENAGGDDQFADAFVQSAEIRNALHLGNAIFNDGLRTYEGLLEDMLKSVKPWVEELLEHYPIVFYSGQQDIIVPYPLTVNFLGQLSWSGASDYADAVRQPWFVGKQLAGYYKVAGNLIEVLVRGAGHMVPTSQPRFALQLLKSFVEGKIQ